MTYNPAPDPAAFRPGITGDTDLYGTYLVPNHDEVYAAYTPPIVDAPSRGITIAAGSTNAEALVWRIRGNRDLLTVRTRFRCTTTGGAASARVSIGGAGATSAPSGVEAWYTHNVTPLQGGVVDCGLTFTTGGGVSVDLARAQCYLVGAAPAAGRRPSGFARGYSDHYVANAAVASEHVSRYKNGPVHIARDRPVPVFEHITQPTTTGAKSLSAWQSFNSVGQDLVGRGSVPFCEDGTRPYVLDIYSVQDNGGGEFTLSIGAWSQRFTTPGIKGWNTVELELPRGPHEVRCSVKPGASNQLRVATVQLWRMEL